MTVRDPNNPHPAHTAEWAKANASYAEELSRRTGPHPACFPAGTPVLTALGSRPIEVFQAGDDVLSVGERGQLRPRRVHRVLPPARARLLTIHWESGRTPLATTAHHAFSTARGWVRSAHLRPGDRVQRFHPSGRSACGVVARTEAQQTTDEVFNLIVEVDLNFIAGGCLVHSFGYARALRSAWHRLRLAAERAIGTTGTWRLPPVPCPPR